MELTKTQQIIKDYNGLSWQDKAKAINRFHQAKQEEKGTPVLGHRIAYSWRVKDTAKFFGISIGATSEYLRLAQYTNENNVVNEQTGIVNALAVRIRRYY